MSDLARFHEILRPSDNFVDRHIGPRDADIDRMLKVCGVSSLDALIDETIPKDIRLKTPIRLDPPRCERETLQELREIAAKNTPLRSLIGMGYYGVITPPVILRNILENPGWYTQYTPYQPEISQGRLEALINFQTTVADLTGLPVANASLLDEATAAAEAMHMCLAACREDAEQRSFFVAQDCHPQTIAVVQTRARPLGIQISVADPVKIDFASSSYFGVLLQYPTTDGRIEDYAAITEKAHAAGARVVVATDLLALALLKPPGEWGADIVVGSSQRFGVPMGGGGPHAAFMATREEYTRQMPGRLIGVSKDAVGNVAYRLAIQTREQHIRRDKATSNICTTQVLLAIIAGMYAVYHGPAGVRRIAERVHALTALLASGLKKMHFAVGETPFFDTLYVQTPGRARQLETALRKRGYNLRTYGEDAVGAAFDETTTLADVQTILDAFASASENDASAPGIDSLVQHADFSIPAAFARSSPFLTHPVFNRHHSEHEMLRYLYRLQQRDLSLATSMIPLGSCTMKLNATSEMIPVTWRDFSDIHPFAPADQQAGYAALYHQLENWLAEITGFAAVSLQPNAGAQGEFAGLLAIRGYHESRRQSHRTVCLIPVSAHGTNPASAVMAGYQVVPVACDARGNIDVADLRAKTERNREKLAALMITYPSTHGVFEEHVRDICAIVHEHGGQVYMDGANMNAQVALTRPAEIGADVCHLNLHKTFCIPHGGGGPGMGPIAVREHLAPFLPGHPMAVDPSRVGTSATGEKMHADRGNARHPSPVGPVSAAPYGSPGILPISWMYIRMMGEAGLRKATQIAILNANYMAARLREHYPVLYAGRNGRVAHEFILDLREFRKSADIEPTDVAKRLMDFGFHAPTMSWPVPGTLMIEPTESESKEELDRFCEAMIAIREEIRAIESGRWPPDNNPLKNAPHTAADIATGEWNHPYSREQAAFPAPWVRDRKFWPAVGRIDNAWGDRNLFCTCPPVEAATQGAETLSVG